MGIYFDNFQFGELVKAGQSEHLECSNLRFSVVFCDSLKKRNAVEVRLKHCLIYQASDVELLLEENYYPMPRLAAVFRLLLLSAECEDLACRVWNAHGLEIFMEDYNAGSIWRRHAEAMLTSIIEFACNLQRKAFIKALLKSLKTISLPHQKLAEKIVVQLFLMMVACSWRSGLELCCRQWPEVKYDFPLGFWWSDYTPDAAFRSWVQNLLQATLGVRAAVHISAMYFFSEEYLRDSAYKWLSKYKVAELNKEGFLAKLCRSWPFDDLILSKNLERVFKKFSGLNIHIGDDAALRAALIRDFPAVTKLLIGKGADINKAYSKTVAVQSASGEAAAYAAGVKTLHDELRKTNIPETDYEEIFGSLLAVRTSYHGLGGDCDSQCSRC